MKDHRLLKEIIHLGGILFLLTGCSTYASTPVSLTPNVTLVPTTSTTGASSFTGSVVLEDGRCCIGGIDGDTVQAQVKFSASSPFGKVTDMRVSTAAGCSSPAQMESVDWEPFVPARSIPMKVVINFVGFYVSAQFRDELGNVSPVYCDDISVEGSPRIPIVNPTDWYPQIKCFSENEVHPGQGETVTGAATTFNWPSTNNLPDGVFFKVSLYGAGDGYTALVASGQTRETSLSLQIPPERTGDIVWTLTLADANGDLLDHGRCSSFPASLLTVDPPSGIKGVHFLYQP
jgi:hypothetical protein